MIPVDHERRAVITADLERAAVDSDQLALRLKFTFTFALEEKERSSEVAGDQIQIAVAVPIDSHGPGANDVYNPLIVLPRFLHGNEQRLVVGPLESFRLLERTVRLAPKNLEQSGHR